MSAYRRPIQLAPCASFEDREGAAFDIYLREPIPPTAINLTLYSVVLDGVFTGLTGLLIALS
jgi:hypothetical protein